MLHTYISIDMSFCCSTYNYSDPLKTFQGYKICPFYMLLLLLLLLLFPVFLCSFPRTIPSVA